MRPPARPFVAVLATAVAIAVVAAAVLLLDGGSDGSDAPHIASAVRDGNDRGAGEQDSGPVRRRSGGGSTRGTGGNDRAGRGGRGSRRTAGRGGGAGGSRGSDGDTTRGGGDGGDTLEDGEGGGTLGDGASGTDDGGGGAPIGGGGGGNATDGGGGGDASGGGGSGGNGPAGGDNGPGAALDGGGESSASNEVTVGPPFENGPLAQVRFGTVAAGSSSRVRITVRNVAEDGVPRAVTSVNIRGVNPGDFAVTENKCQDELPEQGACTLQVTFTPTATGERRATMDVNVGPCCGKAIALVGGPAAEGASAEAAG